MKMAKTLCLDPETFASPLLIASECMWWIKKFLVPFCKQTIDKYGEHATCCKKQGDLIIRHDGLHDFVEEIANDGMLSPVLEKEGILGNTTGRRPGDVTIQRWAEGKGLALRTPANTMLRYRSMVNMMQAFRELTISSVQWYLKHSVRLMLKEKRFYGSYSASQQSN